MILERAHNIKHSAVAQKHVTLSTGMVPRRAGECSRVKVAVHAESSAAIGICRRSGIERVPDLAVGQLWVKERIRQAGSQPAQGPR